jgi:hypothetical protein
MIGFPEFFSVGLAVEVSSDFFDERLRHRNNSTKITTTAAPAYIIVLRSNF